MPRTRLAPSPTGALHLGNARTFLINWALARQNDWEIVLRIEDLDGPRIKEGAAEEAIELLEWLGLDWDEGPHYQIGNLEPYEAALTKLAELGEIYPCGCTRKQIEAASLSAPHEGEHELRYPGTCRPVGRTAEAVAAGSFQERGDVAWRVCVPDVPINFEDQFSGPQAFDVQQSIGDFLVRTKAGLPSYQLAVVVDDARQGIDQVVRGDDLLSSTSRQLLLYDLLQLEPCPSYIHLPLVIGTDGRRLAKRHGDSRLAYYREQGVTAERIIGLLAEWSGCGPRGKMTASEFLREFELSRMSAEAITFTPADNSWLIGGK